METALSVLFCDNHLLAVSKPSCLPVVPDESGDTSLLDLAKEWVRREFAKPGAAYLGVVHRLDRPVSGVVLFARTSKAAARLTDQFRTGRVRKVYWALSEGCPQGASGTLEQWLRKDSDRRRVEARSEAWADAKRAVTDWRSGALAPVRTWFRFEPRTGRAHQLRVAAATLGAPLLGDLKYGAREALPDRSIALHARSLEVEHPTRRERMRFEVRPPECPWWAGVEELGKAGIEGAEGLRGAED